MSFFWLEVALPVFGYLASWLWLGWLFNIIFYALSWWILDPHTEVLNG